MIDDAAAREPPERLSDSDGDDAAITAAIFAAIPIIRAWEESDELAYDLAVRMQQHFAGFGGPPIERKV